MSLISKNDLIKAAGLDKFGFLKGPMANLLMSVSKLNKVNDLYDEVKNLRGKDFFDAYVQKLGLKYVVFEEDLAKIPKEGPFILVANHPLGAIDGVIMLKILTEIRPDFKILSNFLLDKIDPMKDYVIPVNPFEGRKDTFNSSIGMRESLRHLKNNACIGMFPAGEVSNKNNPENEIRDKEWELTALKLIKKAGVPVVPMYFHASNSQLFYQMAKLHPDLQSIMLPSEMMKKREKPIKIRIGKLVTPQQIQSEPTPEAVGVLLRKKIHLLKAYHEKRKTLANQMDLPNLKLTLPSILQDENIVQNIIDPTPQENLLKEIKALRELDKMLFSNGNYEVYFTEYEKIPSIIREIGRQREMTFRAVGEGSNLPFDLDEYDKHYHHLFLWDNLEKKLVGAYRMGMGKHLIKNNGIKGFYTSSLFEFDSELHPFFNKVIEMGRAYVTQEYQQKPYPLFLLWRGIVHVCLRNSDYKFLMGGVSISNKFSDFSKSLIIEFMRSNYFDSAVAQYIHPKNEYKVQLNEQDKKLFFDEVESDLNKLDKIIDDLEPEMRMPVLIKKYIKQNAKVVAFNVDPSFNDAIDGLMYIRISELPESTINPVLEELSKQMEK